MEDVGCVGKWHVSLWGMNRLRHEGIEGGCEGRWEVVWIEEVGYELLGHGS